MRGPPSGNLFEPPGSEPSEERFEILAEGSAVRIERIVSTGQASPEGFWYDQGEDEWVVVLVGRASLELEGLAEKIEMKPGDWRLIPAHQRHRVASTSKRPATIWLAVHFTGSR